MRDKHMDDIPLYIYIHTNVYKYRQFSRMYDLCGAHFGLSQLTQENSISRIFINVSKISDDIYQKIMQKLQIVITVFIWVEAAPE